MKLRSPTAGEVAALGFLMLVGSMILWTGVQVYDTRYQIIQSFVHLVQFILDWPEGTLMTTGFTGAVLLILGIMAMIDSPN